MDLPLLSLALTGLVTAALLPKGRQAGALLRWRVAWAWTAWLGWALLSALVSGRGFVAFSGTPFNLMGWFTVAVVGSIALASAASGTGMRTALQRLAPIVVGVEAVFVLLDWLQGASELGGTLSNSTYLAEVLVLFLPLVADSALSAGKTRERVWRWAVVASGLAAVVWASARAALLGLLVWAAVLAFIELRRRANWSTGRVLGVVGGCAVAVLALVAVLGRSRIVSGLGWTAAVRANIWQPVAKAVGLRPLFGWGPDGYQAAVYGFVKPPTVHGIGFGQVAPDPHNLLVWIVVSTGVVGLALFAWLAFEIGRNWVKQARAGSGPTVAPFVAGALLYAFVALSAPTALQTLPLAALVIGASLRIERADSSASSIRVAELATRALAITLSLLLCAMATTRLSIAREDQPGGYDPVRTQRAADLWRIDPFLYYQASIGWGYAAARGTQSVPTADADLAAIRRAVALAPTDPVYQTELARTLAFYRAPRETVSAAFERALELFPNSPDARTSYAGYLIAQGDLPAARRELDRVRTLEDLPAVMRANAAYFRALGDSARAAGWEAKQEAAEAADTSGPSDGGP